MTPIIYSEEGKVISEKLWRETLAELSFANVEDALEAVNK